MCVLLLCFFLPTDREGTPVIVKVFQIEFSGVLGIPSLSSPSSLSLRLFDLFQRLCWCRLLLTLTTSATTHQVQYPEVASHYAADFDNLEVADQNH